MNEIEELLKALVKDKSNEKSTKIMNKARKNAGIKTRLNPSQVLSMIQIRKQGNGKILAQEFQRSSVSLFESGYVSKSVSEVTRRNGIPMVAWSLTEKGEEYLEHYLNGLGITISQAKQKYDNAKAL
jgi:hypothetical protein